MMNRLRQINASKLTAAIFLGVGGVGFYAFPAQAQEESFMMEEVVVSARKRDERLQEVPVSVSVFTESTIERAGIERPADFLALTPNVAFTASQNAGNSAISIRGVSQVRNQDSSVAVVIDGVVMSSPSLFNQELFDVKQIEVLKGPQGALYGRNSIGGAINITTQAPDSEFGGKVVVGAGNGNRTKTQFSLNAPLVDDQLYFRLSGSRLSHDGYLKNVFLDTNVDPFEESSIRARLLWTPSENLDVDLRHTNVETEGGALNFFWNINPDFSPKSADNTDFDYNADFVGINERSIKSSSLKIDYETGLGTFTSITGYDDLDEFYVGDQFPYVNGGGVASFFSPGINIQIEELETTSQEFRLTSPDDQAFRWIAGAYYLETERLFALPISLDTSASLFTSGSTQGCIQIVTDNPLCPTIFVTADTDDNKAYAVFGQFNWDYTDNLEISFALRYDNDKRERTNIVPAPGTAPLPNGTVIANPRGAGSFVVSVENADSGTVREETFSSLQPKLTLSYSLSSDISMYGTLSRGFRSGGYNTSNAPALAALEGIEGVEVSYDKEVSSNVEVGFKSTLNDGRITFNGAAFYTEVDDQHFFQFTPVFALQIITGLDKVTLKGFELDLNANVASGFDVFAALGYTDSKINKYDIEPTTEGNVVPYIPKTTFNLGSQYRVALNDSVDGFVRIDYERRGKQYWDARNTTPRSALDLVNARFGVESEEDRWSVTAWVKNMTDEEYLEEYVRGAFVVKAQPRTYGIDLVKRF